MHMSDLEWVLGMCTIGTSMKLHKDCVRLLQTLKWSGTFPVLSYDPDSLLSEILDLPLGTKRVFIMGVIIRNTMRDSWPGDEYKRICQVDVTLSCTVSLPLAMSEGR